MSTERPTQISPPNSPTNDDHVHHVDDPLDPKPGPDHPNRLDANSPAEKARWDWGNPTGEDD